jgi:hypothetical protein
MNHRAILFISLSCFTLLFSLNGYCTDKYAPLTKESILNADYLIPMEDRTIKVINGKYEEKLPNPYERLYVIEDSITRGDLNHDGSEDVSVLYTESSGGSGCNYYLAAFLNENGKPRNVDSIGIGDRINVQKIYYKNASIFIQAIIQGENDALCCPTKLVLMGIILQNNRLMIKEFPPQGKVAKQDSNE